MKKILLIVVCIFSFSKVFASSLESIDLPYYVKINMPGKTPEILQIKKVYDKDNLDAVFNINFQNYTTGDNFNIYEDINRGNYGQYYKSIGFFNTIVYFGYNLDKSDLNYFITQILIWELISNSVVVITDELGNSINDYNNKYIDIRNKIMNYLSSSPFYNKEFSSEIWDSTTLEYRYTNTILDNPIIDGLTFKNENYNLIIDNHKIGNYKVELTKINEQEDYSYNDGNNIYWKSLKGPENLYKSFKYNVYGTKLNIKENIIGINNLTGDAKSSSKYELYMNDELKLVIDEMNDIYVKSNSSYKLKNISNDIGIYLVEDITFDVLNEEYDLIIDKYVISKNISISILDEYSYNIYLKSNNQLYEVIDSNTSLITLPYGIYYIKDELGSFYQEIEVLDNKDEVLIIDNRKEEIEDKIENEVIEDNISNETINDNIENDIKDDISNDIEEDNNKDIIDTEVEDIIYEKEIIEEVPIVEIETPKTFDNIYLYIILAIINIIFLLCYVKRELD